jgi:hypothetical protein
VPILVPLHPYATKMVSPCRVPLAAALLLLVLPGPALAAEITPVQSVLGMLSDMKAKGEKDMATEAKVYAEYAEWVDDQTKDLNFEIETGASNIKSLIAFIEDADAKVAALGDAIAALDDQIASLEKAKADSTALRTEQNTEFVAMETDLSESIDALERAIQVLSAQAYSRPQALMLLQKLAKTKPGMRRVLAAFLSEGTRGDGAPAVAAYEFQSGGIVAVLEGLDKKFKGELSDLQTDESNKKHYYDLEQIHLSDTIATTTGDREDKASLKASTAAASAKAKGELAEAKEQKAADEKQLADMTATFESKTATFKENQKVRTEELEALTKAIEIISAPDVAGSYAGHVNAAMAQTGKAVSLLQVGAARARSAKQQRAVEFLKKRASALSSSTLARFATQAAGNPFEKVIQMIKDLLEKLKEEAAAEAEHKAWCDEQLHDNKLKRNKQTAAVNKLIAEIEVTAGEIADLGASIDTLVTEQAELAKAMEEATAIREKEHAENTATIADAVAGQEAVKKALAVLREFYSTQGPALIQKKQVPEMEAYYGMQNSKGGPIGMLEVILTDFARLQADTEAAETAAASEYATFMEDSKASKIAKHKQEVADRLAKDAAEFKKSQLKKDLEAEEAELAAANTYYEELKPLCTIVPVSYEERVAKRKEELAALNEAYDILDQKGA